MNSFDRLVIGILTGLAVAISAVILIGDRTGVVVTTVYPPDGSMPPSTTEVRLAFAERMIPEGVQSRFSISPSVSGVFIWERQTDHVIFRPDNALVEGQVYTVSLDSGAQGVSGRTTLTDLTWSFTPRLPRVLFLTPSSSDNRSLWMAAPDGSGAQQVYASENGVGDFYPSPDGTQIAVTVYYPDYTSDIWIIGLDGGGRRQITRCTPGICSTPAWSPDGTLIAYARQDIAPSTGLPGPSRIWLYDVTTGETAPVYEDNQVLGYLPTWTLDGRRLAFYDANARGYRVLTLETGADVVVLNESSLGMSFSHDSRALVYADVRELDRLHVPTLYVTQLEAGSQPKPLLDHPGIEEQPAWSPDGGWVAFGHRSLEHLAQNPASQMSLLNLYTGEVIIPPQDPVYTNSLFTWDPSGKRLLMQRFKMGDAVARPEIWTYDLDSDTFVPVSQDAITGRWIP